MSPRRHDLTCDAFLDALEVVLAKKADILTKKLRTLEADHRAQTRWIADRIRAEDAALRVIDGSELVSATIDHFDDAILSSATDEWQKAAVIVGGTMWDLVTKPIPQYVGDILIWSRVRALMVSGALESEGDDTELHRCVVRRRHGVERPAGRRFLGGDEEQ